MTVPPASVQVETGHQDMIVRFPLCPLRSGPRRDHRLVYSRLQEELTFMPSCTTFQHDAQLDYYGRRLATASSDRTVRVFDVEQDDSYKLVDALQG